MSEHCRLAAKKEDNVIGLAASEMKCYLRGEPGHVKRDCPRNSRGNGGHGNGRRSRNKIFLMESAINAASGTILNPTAGC